MTNDTDRSGMPRLAMALQSLPLLGDDPYLRMQGFNLGVVSSILDEMENQLLVDYIQEEKTPSTAIVVSAISQLWVFGIYELLRTWRQRLKEIIKFGKMMAEHPSDDREALIAARLEKVRQDSADPQFTNPSIGRAFDMVGRDESFRRDYELRLTVRRFRSGELKRYVFTSPNTRSQKWAFMEWLPATAVLTSQTEVCFGKYRSETWKSITFHGAA